MISCKMWPLLICWALIVLYLCKKYLDNKFYGYWEKRGVSVPKFWYFVGNFWETVRMRKSAPEVCADVYKKYEGYNYVGFYKFLTPAIVVRSPELVKDILVKNFHSFYNNDYFVHPKTDPVLAKNPFLLRYSAWKITRSQLSPNYSTSKVKAMMPIIMVNESKLQKYLLESCTPKMTIDAKELASKFTCENFASCSVGFNGCCFSDPNSEFMKMGNHFNGPTWANAWKTFSIFICPFLSKLFHVRLFDDVLTNFSERIIKESLEHRKSDKGIRYDLLESFSSIRRKTGDENVFGIDDVKAHVGGFLFDGFETSAIALSYALVEIAANPEVQDALKEEIIDFFSAHDELSYEDLQNMPYLDGVLQETLRKHVPLPILVKRCTEPYKLPPMFENSKGPEPVIDPGTIALIPVYALHYDEKYFPEPEKFRPERFTKDSDIIKGTYLPFGDGPRICLGMKFGIMQVKIAIVSIVKNYELRLNEKTKMPMKIDPFSFFMAPNSALWIDVTKRHD